VFVSNSVEDINDLHEYHFARIVIQEDRKLIIQSIARIWQVVIQLVLFDE